MRKLHNPGMASPPFGRYSNGVEVGARARWLHVSGQVGADPKGGLPPDFEGQAGNAWRNVIAVLESAGMTVEDLVKITVYITRPGDVAAYRAVRDRMIGEARPASTLVVVSGLADPRWLIEIEAIAADSRV
jgi:enamine deaminase RidA (YjgF/YER057c/UK114 family)